MSLGTIYWKMIAWTLPASAGSAAVALALGGTSGLVRAVAAFALCLTIALATLHVACWAIARTEHAAWRSAALLAGTGVRMVGVLAGGSALYLAVPVLRSADFFVWLTVAYLATLAVEVALVLGVLPGTRRADGELGGTGPEPA